MVVNISLANQENILLDIGTNTLNDFVYGCRANSMLYIFPLGKVIFTEHICSIEKFGDITFDAILNVKYNYQFIRS